MHMTALPCGSRLTCALTDEGPRRFLYNMGQAKSRAYIINGLAMLASFFIFRNVLGVGASPRRSGMGDCTCAGVFCAQPVLPSQQSCSSSRSGAHAC